MKTTFLLLLSTALLTNPASAGFGKTPDRALTKKPVSSPRRRWSSTGVQGLSHENMDEVVTVKAIKKKIPQDDKSKEEGDAFLEHHPFASGVFSQQGPHHLVHPIEG